MIHNRYQHIFFPFACRRCVKLIFVVAPIFIFLDNITPNNNFVIALKNWSKNYKNNYHHLINNDYRSQYSSSRLYQYRGGSDEIPSRNPKKFRSSHSQSSRKQRSQRRDERSIYENDLIGSRYSDDSNKEIERKKISKKLKSRKKRSRRELKPKKNVLILQAKKLIVVNGQQKSDKSDRISNEFTLSSTGQRRQKASGHHRKNKNKYNYRETNNGAYQNDSRNLSSTALSSSKQKLKGTDDTKNDKKKKNVEKHREKQLKKSRLIKNISANNVRKSRETKTNNLKKESEVSKNTNVEYRPKIRSTILSSLNLLENVDKKKVRKADNRTQSDGILDELQLKRDLNDGEFETLLKDLLQDDSTEDDETNDQVASDLKQESDEEVINYEYEYYDTSYDILELPISEEIAENIISSEKNIQSDSLYDEMEVDEYYDTPNLYKYDEMNGYVKSRKSHDEIGHVQDDYYDDIQLHRYNNDPSFYIDHDNAHYDSFVSDANIIDDPYEYFVYDDYDNYDNYDVYFNEGPEDFNESLPRYRHLRPPDVSFQRGPRDNQRYYHGIKQGQSDVDVDIQSTRMPRNKVAESLLYREEPMANIQNDYDLPPRQKYHDRFSHNDLREQRDNRFSRRNEYYSDNNKNDIVLEPNLDDFEDNQNDWHNHMNTKDHNIIDHYSSENKYHDDIQIEGTSSKMRNYLGENVRHYSMNKGEKNMQVESLGSSNQMEFADRISANAINPVPIALQNSPQEQYIDSESYDDELLDDDELLLLNESSSRIKLENSDLMNTNTIKNHGENESANLSMNQVLNSKVTKTNPGKLNEEERIESLSDEERLNEDDIGILESLPSQKMKKKSIFSTLLGKNIFGWGLKESQVDDENKKNKSSKLNQKEPFDAEDVKEENMIFKQKLNKEGISNKNIDNDEALDKKSDIIENIIEDTIEREETSEEISEKLERIDDVETNIVYSMGFCEVIISINTYFLNEEQSIHVIPSPLTSPSNNNDLESKDQPTQSTEYLEEELSPPTGPSSHNDFESNGSKATNHNRFVDNPQDFHTITDNESTYDEPPPPPPPPPSTNFEHDVQMNQSPLNAEYIENVETPISPPPMYAHANLNPQNVMPTQHNQYYHTHQNNYQSPPPPPPPLFGMSEAYELENSISTQRNEFDHNYDYSQFHCNDEGIRSYQSPPPPPPVSSVPGYFQSDNSLTTPKNGSMQPSYSSHPPGKYQNTEVNDGIQMPPPPPPPAT